MNRTRHNSQSLGKLGEQIAEQALLSHGCSVVARNWRCVYGEIDIIVRDADELVFVEVKTRSTDSFGSGEEAVTDIKQQHLLNSAQMYLEAAGLPDVPWRIDIVSIDVAPSNRVMNLRILRDAIRAQNIG